MVYINLEQVLKDKSKTKYWLAHQINIGYQNLTRLMRNETSSIRFDTIDRICKALNCKVSDLIVFENDEKNK